MSSTMHGQTLIKLTIILASNSISNPIQPVNKQMLPSIRVLVDHFLSSSGEINLSDQLYHFTQAVSRDGGHGSAGRYYSLL